jgi:hypothetical protein
MGSACHAKQPLMSWQLSFSPAIFGCTLVQLLSSWMLDGCITIAWLVVLG